MVAVVGGRLEAELVERTRQRPWPSPSWLRRARDVRGRGAGGRGGEVGRRSDHGGAGGGPVGGGSSAGNRAWEVGAAA